MHVVFRLLCHWSLWSRLPTASAQVPAEPPNESIDWPSPDGKFAFRGSYAEYLHTIDLIDRQSGKKNSASMGTIRAKPSGTRCGRPIHASFALMTRLGHPIQGVDVYVRIRFKVWRFASAAATLSRRSNFLTCPRRTFLTSSSTAGNFPMSPTQNWQEAEA
jgi:hypothetical protein